MMEAGRPITTWAFRYGGNMIKIFMMHIEYHNGEVDIAKGADGKLVVSTEENVYLLNELGDRLIDENIIKGYQIVSPIGMPVRKL